MIENPQLFNGSTLAYIGDAIYELAIRKYLLSSGETNTNNLHKLSVDYVGAKGQAKVIQHWINQDKFLTPEEINIYKRGRNHKANTKAKNASIGDYRQATGFESLMGWLYLTQQESRLQLLIEEAIKLIEKEKR